MRRQHPRADVRRLRDHAARRWRVGRVSRLRRRRSATRGCATSATPSASARCGTCSRPSPPDAASTRWRFTRTTCSARTTSPPRWRFLEDHPALRLRRRRAACSSRSSRQPTALAAPAEPPDHRRRSIRRADFLRADLSRRRADVRVDRLPPVGASPALPCAHDAFATLVDRPFLLAILAKLVGRRHPRSAGLVPQARRQRRPSPGDERRAHPAAVRGCTARRFPSGSSRGGSRRCSTATLDTGCSRCIDLVPPEARPALRPVRLSRVARRPVLRSARWSRGYGRKRLIAVRC